MSIANSVKTTVLHCARINLADDEWGNELMGQVAREYANQHRDYWPLAVEVYEHAGWFLSYLFGAPGIEDGAICGTANDAASLSAKVLAFGKTIRDVVHLGYERRGQ